MEVFKEFLDAIENPQHRVRMEDVLSWVMEKFPDLSPTIKWNQPMFIHHGTFIIGFSISKKHMAVAPEQAGMVRFRDEILMAGYDQTKQIMRIPWDVSVNYSLLEKMIEFNMIDKAECNTFWR